MATVQIKDLVKIYPGSGGPDVKVVHGINLEIKDREFMVLVGPSGCGKSTTLRMVAGLEEISGGTISIDEKVVNNVLPKDRDIAMVFQNYALYPHMTVYDNMAFGLKLRKFPKAEIDQRVREASAMLGLDPYLDRKPKALSGGQRQRVAVGRAKTEGVSLRRAALQSRREDARVHAHRDFQASCPTGCDDDLRDPRSGGGDDDGRPHLRDEGRAHHASRRTA
jgi:ABC-type sugar transport system ATPase subunit